MIIIDPPGAGPWESREKLEAWLRRLQAMRQEYTDAEDVAAIERNITMCEEWIEMDLAGSIRRA